MLVFRWFGWGLVGWLLVLAPGRVAAQRPRGQFLQDSVQIGKPLQYALRFGHRSDLDVFFPDSTFDFFPFELVERVYFPTQTGPQGSVDSVVYTLVSFEIAPVQRLSLPVFVRAEGDCTAVWSVPDSVQRRALIPNPAQARRLRTTRLRVDTRWQPVREQVNYPLLLGILLGFLIGAGLLYGAFGKPIRRWLRMLQLRRRYLEFSRNFQRLSRGISGRKQDLARAERAVVLWKRYVERLERRPVSTFTTRELIDYFPDNPQLAEALRETDAVVYGGVFSPRTSPALQTLRELARQRYRQRRREIAQEGRTETEVPLNVP
jgi:hypothetical protein